VSRRIRRWVAALVPALLMFAAVGALPAATHRVPQSSLPAMRGMPAGVDSGPSPEAQRVLQSIPDPIPASQRVTPSPLALAEARAADNAQAAAARADSARVAGLRDSLATFRADSAAAASRDTLAVSSDSASTDSAGIPVPALVPTLADRSHAEAVVDSTLGASPTADSTTAGRAAAASGAATPATPAECWGVQVGAPTEARKAEALRDAAQSQLLVPMSIESDQGRHKVRTARCLSAAAADSLRHRAVMSGFGGAFRFGGGR